MIGWIVKAIRAIVSIFAIVPGAIWQALTGVTPDLAYQGMIRMFCMTGGISNDFAHGAIRLVRGRRPLTSMNGVLGTLDPSSLAEINAHLRRDGFYVFPQRLPDATVARLVEFALAAEGRYVPGTEKKGEEAAAREARKFDRARPLGVRFDYPARTLVQEEAIQQLMVDPSILAVAQAYLDCDPILDLVFLWWHTAASAEPSAEAAQLFHFDMDRVKWLKFFFYLTDVDDRSGPHVFVPGSHLSGGIPWRMLRKGYQRLGDEDVLGHYGKEGVRQFTGVKGTIIAEDTRGLHKGAHVAEGDRLVFQLEYVDSLFGGKLSGARIENPCERVVQTYNDMPCLFRIFRPEAGPQK